MTTLMCLLKILEVALAHQPHHPQVVLAHQPEVPLIPEVALMPQVPPVTRVPLAHE